MGRSLGSRSGGWVGVGWGEMVEANLFFEGWFKGGEVGQRDKGERRGWLKAQRQTPRGWGEIVERRSGVGEWAVEGLKK